MGWWASTGWQVNPLCTVVYPFENFELNTTGGNNIGLGERNGESNQTGSNNIAMGRENLAFANPLVSSVGMGYFNGRNLTSATSVIAMPYEALYGTADLTASYTIAIGHEAMENTTAAAELDYQIAISSEQILPAKILKAAIIFRNTPSSH